MPDMFGSRGTGNGSDFDLPRQPQLPSPWIGRKWEYVWGSVCSIIQVSLAGD